MNNKNNYREQGIKCCMTCIRGKIIQNNRITLEPSLVCFNEKEDCVQVSAVDYLGICDKYEREGSDEV